MKMILQREGMLLLKYEAGKETGGGCLGRTREGGTQRRGMGCVSPQMGNQCGSCLV